MIQESRLGIYDRLDCTITFEIQSAFHLGSGKVGVFSDALIQRRKNGMPYVPGSSLAGVLRTQVENLSKTITNQEACLDQSCGKCPACSLFGFARDTKDNGNIPGRASRITIGDARLLDAGIPRQMEMRQHVGINRFTSVAQDQLQFDHEIAPGGLRFELDIEIESPTTDDLKILYGVFNIWKEIGLEIGGRTTSGLGASQLIDINLVGIDFSNPDHLKQYLLESQNGYSTTGEQINFKQFKNDFGENDQVTFASDHEDVAQPQHLIFDLYIAGIEPLLVMGMKSGVSTNGKMSDAEFVQTSMVQNGKIAQQMILPGSSLKGALRARTEKIIRTLNYFDSWETANEAVAHPLEAEEIYLERVCACAITNAEVDDSPRLSACFGTKEKQHEAEKALDEVYAASCPSCQIFGNSMLRGRMIIGEGVWVHPEEVKEKLFDHVAIDRFRGGASDAKKFDTLPLIPLHDCQPMFKFQLHLHHPEPWMLGLLFYVFKDLATQDVRIGYGKRRGYGLIRGWIGEATAYLLPGTQMQKAFYENEGEHVFPYQKYALPYPQIFSVKPWDHKLDVWSTEEICFIKGCDKKFHEYLKMYSKPEVVFGQLGGD